MTRIRFISADGHSVQEVDAAAGERLLDVAQAAGQPLEGTCGGQMASSTCHVVDGAEEFGKKPTPKEEEEELLDLAAHVTRHSRLSCQIWLDAALERLTVSIPAAAHNMQGR